jgi:hypothetical protein
MAPVTMVKHQAKGEVRVATAHVRMVSFENRTLTMSMFNQLDFVDPSDVNPWGAVNTSKGRMYIGIDDHANLVRCHRPEVDYSVGTLCLRAFDPMCKRHIGAKTINWQGHEMNVTWCNGAHDGHLTCTGMDWDTTCGYDNLVDDLDMHVAVYHPTEARYAAAWSRAEDLQVLAELFDELPLIIMSGVW